MEISQKNEQAMTYETQQANIHFEVLSMAYSQKYQTAICALVPDEVVQ